MEARAPGWVSTRVVHVRRQLRIVGSTMTFAPPKGGKERDVPLADAVALLFSTPQSAALHRSNFNAGAWQPALRAAGIPAGRANGMHALRHYFASACLANGVDIRALSEYL